MMTCVYPAWYIDFGTQNVTLGGDNFEVPVKQLNFFYLTTYVRERGQKDYFTFFFQAEIFINWVLLARLIIFLNHVYHNNSGFIYLFLKKH